MARLTCCSGRLTLVRVVAGINRGQPPGYRVGPPEKTGPEARSAAKRLARRDRPAGLIVALEGESDGHSSVNRDTRAVDVRRLIGGQEDYGSGNFRGRADAIRRSPLGETVDGLAEHALRTFGEHRAGTDL